MDNYNNNGYNNDSWNNPQGNGPDPQQNNYSNQGYQQPYGTDNNQGYQQPYGTDNNQGHLQQSAHSLLGAVPIIQAAQTIDGINGRDDGQHIEKVEVADSRQKDGDDEQIRPPLGKHLLYA